MVSHPALLTVFSSLAVRTLAYIFLRWIPGHQLPPLIYAFGACHIAAFLITWRFTTPYKLVSEEVDIVSRRKAGETLTNGGATRDEDGDEAPELELELEETVVLEERGPNIAKTLLLGLPSPTSVLWSLATVAVNTTLVLFVADMVYRAPMLYQSHDLAFARVGFVSDNSAELLIREPNTTHLPLYISYRNAPQLEHLDSGFSRPDDAWKSAGQIYWLSNDTDFTYALHIPRLRPSSRYQYAISNNHSGFFKTAPPVGQTALGSDTFTFLTSSCIKPHFPYNPFSHPLSIPGLAHLAKWIPSLHASFMLFLGDFIYIDVPHRFGTDPETYRREYRQVYASPDWKAASESLPWLHVIDDHEIANDWDKNTTHPYPSAIDPWNLYHASVNPPPAAPGTSYYEFTQGPASFFLLDTRRHRTPSHASPATSSRKSMLGRDQLDALLNFLSRSEPPGVKWKLVISSVPFTRNWRFNNADTWAGYLYERRIILEAMWDVGMGGDGVGVVVLSGDRHEFAATAFPPPKHGRWPLSATVHEFSTSPLSMFYLPARTYWEVDGEDDVCIKYLPDGNSKFGAVEISEVRGGEQSLLRFRLFVDGVEAWDYVVTTPPAVVGGGRGKDAVWA